MCNLYSMTKVGYVARKHTLGFGSSPCRRDASQTVRTTV
jgi:hypothetical protein